MIAFHPRRKGAVICSCKVILFAVCVSTLASTAFAQAEPPTQVDASCASYCSARGYESGFCSRACAVQQPTEEIPAGAEFNWQCVTVCRNGGGQLRDCLTPCRRR